jgi:hypothetical protein
VSRLCRRCRVDIDDAHFNAIYCVACRLARARRPFHTLNPTQQVEARALLGTMLRKDIAAHIGVSHSSLQRFCRDAGLSLRCVRYSQETIDDVLAYYAENGKAGIVEQFPGVGWRHIVESLNRGRPARLVPWKPAEIILAAKMAGIVPKNVQAVVLARPNANAGSIGALWQKRLGGQTGSTVHGLRLNLAQILLRPGFPIVDVPYYHLRRGMIRHRLVLWCDMVGYVHPDAPAWVAPAVNALHKFQCWLYGTDDPGAYIRALAAAATQ